ncbi:MAG: SPFH domain-containing protein [Clostridia bacterium]
MGLIKAAVGAVGSTMHDQWKEAIRCENMPNDVLMVKKTTPNGVISNKSTIIVAPGQCAIIYDNGRVIDATAEEGVYTFDESSTPSFFAGQFGDVFKEMWQRFTYNGASAKQQAVFFFNLKEIIDNKFGTPAPIPFQDWSHPIPNQMTNTITPLRVEIKCFGKYTFKIVDPALFMNTLAGTADVYRKDELVEQLRTEVMAVFQNVANELGTEKYKVPVLEMPSQTDEIREMMDEKVFDAKIRERGIEIVCFAVESVTLTDESAKKIDDYELSSNSYMQQGRMVGAYSNAVEDAAKNANGAANGFMGIGMMNMATGGMATGAANGVWNQNNDASRMDLSKKEDKDSSTDETAGGWTCECGHVNPADGKFCSECGKAKTSKKICNKCKMPNEPTNKFCNNCGERL